LHYGTGVFEGIRGYWSSEHEQLFILKLREHYARLQRSVKVLKLKIPISLDELCKTSIELVRKNNFRQDIYIRPLAFKSSEEIGVRLHNLKDSFAIYVTPFGNYVDIERGIRCMVSTWRRIDDNAAPARAQISPVIDVDRRPIGDGQIGPVVTRLQKLYFDIVRGRNSEYRHWLTPVY